jgi:hypothetical protein
VYVEDVNLLGETVNTLKRNTEVLYGVSKQVGRSRSRHIAEKYWISRQKNKSQNQNTNSNNRSYGDVEKGGKQSDQIALIKKIREVYIFTSACRH